VERPDPLASFRPPLLILGSLLIATGAVLLLYVAMLVYQILNAPGDVAIAKFVLEKVSLGDLAVSGTLSNPQDATKNVQFELHWAESARLICFMFIGALAIGILARVLGILISCGSGLMKLAMIGAGQSAKTGQQRY
jgi:hypothetical protein